VNPSRPSGSAQNRTAQRPFLNVMGLLLTRKCPIACPHCVIEAGPQRTEELSLENARDWIRQIAAYRSGHIHVLSLTGGEPLFNLKQFEAVSTFGKECGLFITAVTNAFWATNRSHAGALFRRMSAVGAWSFSADIYHQSQLPFDRVKNAVLAAQDCGLPYSISICTESMTDPEYLRILSLLLEFTDPETIQPTITHPTGFAHNGKASPRFNRSAAPPDYYCPGGEIPLLMPDGRLLACAGPIVALTRSHPLLLGNLNHSPLADLLDAVEENSILHALRIWGPAYLLHRCSDAGLSGFFPSDYAADSVCDACYRLLTNPGLTAFLAQLSHDRAFQREIAWARQYYLGEASMLERLNISD
jgi:hypothetical protein